jgi:hypothetical protein
MNTITSATAPSFTPFVDNTPPVLECVETYTLDFNGQDFFTMADFEEELILEAYDECGGDDITISYAPEYITCEQLGEVIPVTITVCDGADPATARRLHG